MANTIGFDSSWESWTDFGDGIAEAISNVSDLNVDNNNNNKNNNNNNNNNNIISLVIGEALLLSIGLQPHTPSLLLTELPYRVPLLSIGLLGKV